MHVYLTALQRFPVFPPMSIEYIRNGSILFVYTNKNASFSSSWCNKGDVVSAIKRPFEEKIKGSYELTR